MIKRNKASHSFTLFFLVSMSVLVLSEYHRKKKKIMHNSVKIVIKEKSNNTNHIFHSLVFFFFSFLFLLSLFITIDVCVTVYVNSRFSHTDHTPQKKLRIARSSMQ